MGGSNKTTTTQTNQPYKAAQPLMNQGMKDALSMYKAGTLSPVNTSSTVVPFSKQTMQGMNTLQSLSSANSGGAGLSGQYQGIINAGGFNAPQQQAVAGFQQMASGNGLTADQQGAMSGMQSLAANGGLTADQRTAMDQARGLATGSYDMNANPGFADVRRQALEDATFGLNQNAAGMGRYGSGTAQGVMTRELGNLSSRMINDDFNRYLGRRDAAVGQLFDMGQTGHTNMSNAYGQVFDMGQTGQTNRANAQSNLFNAGQAGQENMAAAFQGMQDVVDPMMQVGGAYEDLAGRQLNDQLRINDAKLNQRQNAIRELLGFAAGAGNFGTQTGTAQGPNNTFSNILGAGLGGASLLSML